MSIAYPEGECFFKRSALKTSTYDPDKPEHFYAHFMIEYIWNRPAFHGSDSTTSQYELYYHPRSAYRVVKGENWNTNYGNWDRISILYGKNPHSDKYRCVEHNLCVNGNRFRDQEKGGSLEPWFMVMPMPLFAKREEWILIDRTACIRAIYIPVAQQASEDYPEVCTFLHVNLAIQRDVSIMTHREIRDLDTYNDYIIVDRAETFPLDSTLGLVVDGRWTLAVSVRKLVTLLSLPRALRGHNCFSSHSIVMVDRKLTPTTGAEVKKFSDSADLSWTTVAGANYGLAIQWKPPQATTWLVGFIQNSLTIAVGFIPVIGPLAAVCFPLAWTAVTNPENFESTLKWVIPVADLAMHVSEEVRKSAKEQEKYLPTGWTGNPGEVFGFTYRKTESGTQPATDKKAAPAKSVPPETIKKYEAIRNFKYWSLMKPASAPAPQPVKAKDAPPKAKQVKSVPELPLQTPEKPSLDDLKPSPSFQFASQVLFGSGDISATTENNQGIFQKDSDESEEASANLYDWMDDYLHEELSGD
ncbi:hypothetical protein BO70DRAFT_410606 [Aspergillus heteromorphus CBS 117.55]|uniref:Uncharacterized protein n=1 Tax=Aspergillus heteromorphus CBS 117.55 TaxID=1448321 RepID=A0A317X0A0_9EURO|nr:uncharacterized protein BO70DRAFT_410606 [Aspergillus heteromorphus CBS 117.55]PWY90987.1 hypothetical protein BO70DRAFT_410606 [Aspergillus heteromorphus CBS 117.55]